ncbi:hypothetical protein OAV76_04120 [Schleiferiaceae bacterium]|nr:hypothetical protein [Schleiferiaceae bacterium]
MSRKINLLSLKNSLERMQNRKNRKEAAMEAEKIKIQDEKDMLDVQGAKDGGRMGYKNGSVCKMTTKGRGRAYGKNS